MTDSLDKKHNLCRIVYSPNKSDMCPHLLFSQANLSQPLEQIKSLSIGTPNSTTFLFAPIGKRWL